MTDPESASLRGVRILAFCDYFRPRPSGGSERVALEVYRRMAERGAEVAVVTTAADAGATEVDGLRVFPVPTVDLARYVGAEIAIAPRP